MRTKLLFLLAALPFGTMAQQNFTINGKVKNIKYPAIAYVYYSISGQLLKFSGKVENDMFTIKGTVSEPMKAFVLLFQNGKGTKDAISPDQVGVYLENGTIQIKSPDSLAHAKVSGTRLNNDQQEMIELLRPYKAELADLDKAYKKANGNDDEQVKIKDKYMALLGKQEKAQVNFIKSHHTSLVSLNLLRQYFDPGKDMVKARMLLNTLSPELQALPAAVRYTAKVEKAVNVNVGQVAPDFSMKNTKDEMISLASYKGKYVLLDFWASWCMPCRQENPNVIKAYNDYKNKNFTVVGVSLDGGTDGKAKWLAAIEKDGLPYEQLSDLQGSNNAASRLYSVTEIPSNFLIDPSGKIIAKNLRGKDLSDKLAEVLSKSK